MPARRPDHSTSAARPEGTRTLGPAFLVIALQPASVLDLRERIVATLASLDLGDVQTLPAAAYAAPVVTHAPALAGSVPTSAAAAGITYEDYALAEDLPIPRPGRDRAIERSTFEHEMRLLRQLAREGVPTDPPDALLFQDFVQRHPKGKVGLDSHRRAYVRLLAYHGHDVPRWMSKRWDRGSAKAKAQTRGTIDTRTRFFKNGPLDVRRLLDADAKPFRDPRRNDAFRHAVLLSCLAGPRSGEAHLLRLDHVQPHFQHFEGWPQKKGKPPRTFDLPETWAFRGTGPTIEWYLERVRPRFEPPEHERHYFVNTKGGPYNEATWANNFLSEGTRRILGYPIGPHAFRRFCATIRYCFGWSERQVAELLDDDEKTVREHYIDWTMVRHIRRTFKRPEYDEEKGSPLPPLWKLPDMVGMEDE